MLKSQNICFGPLVCGEDLGQMILQDLVIFFCMRVPSTFTLHLPEPAAEKHFQRLMLPPPGFTWRWCVCNVSSHPTKEPSSGSWHLPQAFGWIPYELFPTETFPLLISQRVSSGEDPEPQLLSTQSLPSEPLFEPFLYCFLARFLIVDPVCIWPARLTSASLNHLFFFLSNLVSGCSLPGFPSAWFRSIAPLGSQ